MSLFYRYGKNGLSADSGYDCVVVPSAENTKRAVSTASEFGGQFFGKDAGMTGTVSVCCKILNILRVTVLVI